jgi:hypothetical protein
VRRSTTNKYLHTYFEYTTEPYLLKHVSPALSARYQLPSTLPALLTAVTDTRVNPPAAAVEILRERVRCMADMQSTQPLWFNECHRRESLRQHRQSDDVTKKEPMVNSYLTGFGAADPQEPSTSHTPPMPAHKEQSATVPLVETVVQCTVNQSASPSTRADAVDNRSDRSFDDSGVVVEANTSARRSSSTGVMLATYTSLGAG